MVNKVLISKSKYLIVVIALGQLKQPRRSNFPCFTHFDLYDVILTTIIYGCSILVAQPHAKERGSKWS